MCEDRINLVVPILHRLSFLLWLLLNHNFLLEWYYLFDVLYGVYINQINMWVFFQLKFRRIDLNIWINNFDKNEMRLFHREFNCFQILDALHYNWDNKNGIY